MSDLLPIQTLDFEGHGMEYFQKDGSIGLSTDSLAEVFNQPVSKINQKITENPELFEGMTFDTVTVSRVKSRTIKCLTRDGCLMYVSLTNYKRYSDDRRGMIIRLKRWLVETGGKVMDGKIQPENPVLPPIADALKEEMARADAMRIVGVDVGRAASVCMAKLEDEYHVDLTYLRNLLTRSDTRKIAYLTATAIGTKFNLSAQSVNNILESAGFQNHCYRTKKTGIKQKIWNLTDKGRFYGETHIERHGETETYSIFWRDSIIEQIQNVLYYRKEGQTGLFLGEISG